jgi:hypothetical protein
MIRFFTMGGNASGLVDRKLLMGYKIRAKRLKGDEREKESELIVWIPKIILAFIVFDFSGIGSSSYNGVSRQTKNTTRVTSPLLTPFSLARRAEATF